MSFPGKSAQVEMIGLVVIVILISLGMLFMAQFALQEEPTKKIFTRKVLAASTMAAMMKTSVPTELGCGFSSQIALEKDILEDCARNFRSETLTECGYSCQFRCEGNHSCDFYNEIVGDLLYETLGTWGKRYEFQSRLVDETEPLVHIYSERGSCPKTRERDSSGSFFLQAEGAGLVESYLYICD